MLTCIASLGFWLSKNLWVDKGTVNLVLLIMILQLKQAHTHTYTEKKKKTFAMEKVVETEMMRRMQSTFLLKIDLC